jgi:hypothetical protein
VGARDGSLKQSDCVEEGSGGLPMGDRTRAMGWGGHAKASTAPQLLWFPALMGGRFEFWRWGLLGVGEAARWW